MGMERFAKRHLQTLNDRLGADVAKPPSDSTFWLLLAVQPGVTESFDALVLIIGGPIGVGGALELLLRETNHRRIHRNGCSG